jgi:MFS family permease
VTPESDATARFQGNDKLLCGIILGVVTFWLFAQTTLNIAPDMGKDLGLDTSTMNIAVAITALFSGIFIVVMGGLADRVGRVKIRGCSNIPFTLWSAADYWTLLKKRQARHLHRRRPCATRRRLSAHSAAPD